MTATTQPNPGVRPAVAAPTLGWVVKRAILGLVIMFVVTGIAAFIAHTSIDASADSIEQNPPGIAIGAPAAAMLKR